ncbi:MAG: 5-formyltetrahydrofolate cyclo-ligase [Pseudomonadota bacterium]|nr:5-formyltetrahydrofolate cyclo-ligase [Pseudomonadota bacterium]
MPHTPITAADVLTLRRQLRRQRRQLSIQQRQQTGISIARQLQRLSIFRQAQRIGVYLDDFGEVPTRAVIELCFRQGKTVYLPRICTLTQQLRFVHIHHSQWRQRRWVRHRLGMFEPRHQRGVAVGQLQLLCMPLVAFDVNGARLGMGGGYYDRTLAHTRTKRPTRIGLAYDFQQVAPLVTQPWDQHLDYCLLAEHCLQFQPKHAP